MLRVVWHDGGSWASYDRDNRRVLLIQKNMRGGYPTRGRGGRTFVEGGGRVTTKPLATEIGSTTGSLNKTSSEKTG